MTAADATSLVCPNCKGTNTTIGGSGSAICTDCVTMWDPNEPLPEPRPVIPPFGMASTEEVYDAGLPKTATASIDELEEDEMMDWLREAPNPSELADRMSALEGGTATLEGGQTAEVVAFTGKDSVIVKAESGDLLDVPLGDVLRIMPAVVIPDPVAQPETEDALAPDLRLALELARVIIRAGCESVNGTGADITPGVPPTGFMPSDPELHEVVERAAGLAVGMLLEVLEADIDAVLRWVGAVEETPEVATETTEETRDANPSNDE